ncbi:MAG: hypothetical protein V7637_1633 [Mycobacteriales bacterium]
MTEPAAVPAAPASQTRPDRAPWSMPRLARLDAAATAAAGISPGDGADSAQSSL